MRQSLRLGDRCVEVNELPHVARHRTSCKLGVYDNIVRDDIAYRPTGAGYDGSDQIGSAFISAQEHLVVELSFDRNRFERSHDLGHDTFIAKGEKQSLVQDLPPLQVFHLGYRKHGQSSRDAQMIEFFCGTPSPRTDRLIDILTTARKTPRSSNAGSVQFDLETRFFALVADTKEHQVGNFILRPRKPKFSIGRTRSAPRKAPLPRPHEFLLTHRPDYRDVALFHRNRL
jgi:hypothetical protein